MLAGLDLSVANDSILTHADDVNFDKVYAAGKRFAFFKATQNAHYIDPQFLAFVDRASRTPIHLGAYAFEDPDNDPTSHVENFLAATAAVLKKLGLAPMFDWERLTKGMSAQQRVDFVCTWAAKHAAERGCGIILYSFRQFLVDRVNELGGPKSAGALELVKFPLAIAQYTNAAHPDLSGLPWSFWSIWQWAASAPGGPIGACDGVKGAVDLDWFQGDEDDLLAIAAPLP